MKIALIIVLFVMSAMGISLSIYGIATLKRLNKNEKERHETFMKLYGEREE